MTADKPKRPMPISAEERAKRAPLPPDVLMCARHDVVHVDKGGGRGLTVTADIRRAALEEAAMACEEYAARCRRSAADRNANNYTVDDYHASGALACAAAIRALLPAPEAIVDRDLKPDNIPRREPPFKVGDRVRYVGDHPAFKGELGTVTEISTLFVALDNGARVSGAGTLFEPADPAPSAARPPLTGPELAAKDGFKPHGQPVTVGPPKPPRPGRMTMREAKAWLIEHFVRVHVTDMGTWVVVDTKSWSILGEGKTLVRAVEKARKAWGER